MRARVRVRVCLCVLPLNFSCLLSPPIIALFQNQHEIWPRVLGSLSCSIFQCYVLRVRVMKNISLLLSLVLMRVCVCVLWCLTCLILRLFEGGWPRYAPACELREVEQTVR